MSVLKPSAALEEIRREIDEIDDAIADLLVRRFAATGRVRAAKSDDGSIATSPLRPAREASVMRRLIARCDGRLSPELLVRLWRVILSSSTLAQAPVAIHVAEYASPDLDLRLLLERHFCGMAVRVHRSPADALAALASSRGDLAVLSTEAPWAEPFLDHASTGLRVIGSLPTLSPRSMPACIVFGFSEPPPSGDDETLVLCRSGEHRPAGAMRWRAQSGTWHVVSLSGYLDQDDPAFPAAGRFPCPIEVSP